MDFKKVKAPSNTITRNPLEISEPTGNIYESLYVISRRANEIGAELKQELDRKLQEFANYSDNLEEVFENREQIEISKYYEKLPKPTLVAMEEFLNNEIPFRNPTKERRSKRQ